MDYWLLSYAHSNICEDEILQFVWNLNLEYVDCNCRCELLEYESMQNNGDLVDTYILFGNDLFIPKRLREEIYPDTGCTITTINETEAHRLCFPYLQERAKEMWEEINYHMDGILSEKEEDELYTTIQKMYYIPRLESWASEKVRKFYKGREKIYLEKNPPEFQKEYKIFMAKCNMFLGSLEKYEPYVVEMDGQIVYYGRYRSWFTDVSKNLIFFFFSGGNHRIKKSAYSDINIEYVNIFGGGKVHIGSFAFSGCRHLKEFTMSDKVKVEKMEMPFSCFDDCSRLIKIKAPTKFYRDSRTRWNLVKVTKQLKTLQ